MVAEPAPPPSPLPAPDPSAPADGAGSTAGEAAPTLPMAPAAQSLPTDPTDLSRKRGLPDFSPGQALAAWTLLAVGGVGIALQSWWSTPDPRSPRPPIVTAPPKSFQLDLNRATAEEIALLPRMSPTMAARVIETRTSLGGFRSWKELDAIAGIGPVAVRRMQKEAYLGPVGEPEPEGR